MLPLSTLPGPCSWLWPFPPVFNVDTHESSNKRTSASLSSTTSGPMTCWAGSCDHACHLWQAFLLPLQNEACAHGIGHQPELIVPWLWGHQPRCHLQDLWLWPGAHAVLLDTDEVKGEKQYAVCSVPSCISSCLWALLLVNLRQGLHHDPSL